MRLNQMYKTPPKSEHGLTLVEMIMYMALLSILLVVMTNVFVSTLEIKKAAEAASFVDQDGRFILARLSFDINRATAITTPVNSGDSGPTLILTIGAQTLTYKQTSNRLTINDGSGDGDQNLNSSGTVLAVAPVFQKIKPVGATDNIKVQFSLRSLIPVSGVFETQAFQVSVTKRL